MIKTQIFQSMIVFKNTPCEGDVIPPHIFEQGLMLNSDCFVKLLENAVQSWLERVAARGSYM